MMMMMMMILQQYGEQTPLDRSPQKICEIVGGHHSNFGFNIFRGFRSTGGQYFRFPIDFTDRRYNSAVLMLQRSLWFISGSVERQ